MTSRLVALLTHRSTAWITWLLGGALIVALAWRQAWVDEDGFITFRTIDNFVNGYGLRWNIDDRVQSFTHPLWLMLCTPLYYFVRDVHLTTTAVSLIATAIAIWLAGARSRREPLALVFGIVAPLAASASFVLFSTSGFENALVHACLAWFALIYLNDTRAEVPWGWIALAGALCALTRLDTVLFFVPPIALVLLTRLREVRWRRFLLGLSPVVAWMGFSLFYYGFVFPNTKLAKLNEEIPAAAVARQGLYYALDLFQRDPVGMLAIVTGLTITGVRGWLWLRARGDRDLRRFGFGAGMALYCGYVVAIGGCYLSGRFWTAPILAACILWAEELRELIPRFASPRGALSAAAAVAGVAIAMVAGHRALSEVESPALIELRGRAHAYLDENFSWQLTKEAQLYQDAGERERVKARERGRTVCPALAIGRWGMAAGPRVTMIDRNALADPLLARLPSERNELIMMGHFPRALPDGYLEARRTGSLDTMHPELRAYYRPLRRIVSGPLWSWDRLKTIAAFHLGRYDSHLEAYLESLSKGGPPDATK